MRELKAFLLRLALALGFAGAVCLGGFLFVSLWQPEVVVLYTNDTYDALEPCG